MPVAELIAIAHLGTHLWSLFQAGTTAFNWAQAHDQLAGAESQLDEMKNVRPAEHGHPEWARQDGYFDQRRKPFPDMRKVVSEARQACKQRNKEAFTYAIKKLATMGADLGH